MTADDTHITPAPRTALTHGLTAQAIVIPAEDPGEWEDHSTETLDSYDPQTPLERSLALRVAELIWRLRRIARSEADAITSYHEELDAWHSERLSILANNGVEGEPPRPPFAPRLPRSNEIEHIIRYEAHLNRQLLQTMHELEALQSRRLGRHTPLARVDFLALARE